MARATMTFSAMETARRASDEDVSMARMIGPARSALKPLFDIISGGIIYWRAVVEQFRPLRDFAYAFARQTIAVDSDAAAISRDQKAVSWHTPLLPARRFLRAFLR